MRHARFKVGPAALAIASMMSAASAQPISSTSPATRAAPRDVSPIVRNVLARHKVPALVGAIVELHGASAIGVAGVRSAAAPEPFLAGDAIHLGSCTKAMTAVLIAQLVESGELAYDTTMADAFPAIAPRMHPASRGITVEQLLAHRAGLPANVAWALYAKGAGPVTAQRLRVVENVLLAPPIDPPGTRHVYSNVGYMLLGAIVEAKTQRPWEQAIAERLFAPLGMTTAGFGPPREAWGHVVGGNGYEPVRADNAEPLGPAGRVHCTIEDWSRFVAFTLRAQRDDTPLLTSAAMRRLITPTLGGEYAGGWTLATRGWAGGPVLVHGGSNTMWRCVAWLAPEKGFAVLAATNASDADAAQACDELSSALIRERERGQ